MDDSMTVGHFLKENIGKMGENIVIRRFKRIELGVND
jgi:translation elongation factor EF-Ts